MYLEQRPVLPEVLKMYLGLLPTQLRATALNQVNICTHKLCVIIFFGIIGNILEANKPSASEGKFQLCGFQRFPIP